MSAVSIEYSSGYTDDDGWIVTDSVATDGTVQRFDPADVEGTCTVFPLPRPEVGQTVTLTRMGTEPIDVEIVGEFADGLLAVIEEDTDVEFCIRPIAYNLATIH